MKCYKCHEEMCPIMDTAWRKHRDGTKSRETELFCPECRVWAIIKIDDYSNCDLDELLKEVEE